MLDELEKEEIKSWVPPEEWEDKRAKYFRKFGKVGHICPHCGRCSHCGRGVYDPYPHHWVPPYGPYHPIITWNDESSSIGCIPEGTWITY